MVDERELEASVADRPELEAALESILAADEAEETWEFDDVPVDTGLFGEIVGQGIVERSDDGSYRLADPGAVEAALTGDVSDSAAADPENTGRADVDPAGDGRSISKTGSALSAPSVSRDALDPNALARTASRRIAATPDAARRVAVGLAVVAVFVWARTSVYASVFREGDVVLMGNDPYHYRYWTETLLARSASPLDLGTVADAPTGEPLLVATLWWVSALLGGSAETAGLVLAWYPVLAGLVVAAFLYVLAARVLGDRRVGVVAVLVLALIPGHAMRTALGFADHHAFDYAWLMATITILAWLVTLETDRGEALLGRQTRLGAVALGVAVAGLTHAWNASPLVLLPIGLYLAAQVLLDVRADRRPIPANAPVLAGLGVGAILALAMHAALGWQQTAVVAAPALLVAGGVAVAAVGEAGRRRDVPMRTLAAGEIVAGIAGLAVLAQGFPSIWGSLWSGLDVLSASRNIGETVSLFAPSRTFGVELVGLVHLFALPVVAWSVWRAAIDDRRWLVVSVYTCYMLLLSAFQLRFVGQLSPLVSLYAALGLLWALARYDVVAAPAPFADSASEERTTAVDREGTLAARRSDGGGESDAGWLSRHNLTVRSVLVSLVLVGLLVGPAHANLSEEVSSPAVEDRVYETAAWMANDADERGWSASESYVLSSWGDNRIYNYFVNGESRGYGYAQSNYRDFLVSQDPNATYHRYRDRVGYVVLEPIERRQNTLFHHLYVSYGRGWADGTYDAVEHFRAVYVTERQRNKVFVMVPGATLTGTVEPNATVEAEIDVEIPNAQFAYGQETTTGADGRFAMTVPYPGEYDLTVGNETRTVTVPESAVQNGSTVAVDG